MTNYGRDSGDHDLESKIRDIEIQQQVLRKIYARSSEQITHFSETVTALREDMIRFIEHHKTTQGSVKYVNEKIDKITDTCIQRHLDFTRHYDDYKRKVEEMNEITDELKKLDEAIVAVKEDHCATRSKLNRMLLIMGVIATLVAGTITIMSNISTATGGYFGLYYVSPEPPAK